MAITGDQRLLKRINRMALVRLVRGQPGLSRAELAAETGLTKSTVSLLVQELIDEGWLREDEVLVTGNLGRRPTPLRLDDRRLVLLGVELGVGRLSVVSISLAGDVIAHDDAVFCAGDEVAAILEQLAGMVCAQVVANREAGRAVLGLGVGLPGAVQESSGVLAVAPNLGWRNVAVRDGIVRRLVAHGVSEIPVFVQNDGDVAALGEVEFCSTAVSDPLLYLGLGVGVGSGVVVGGRLLLGSRGFAGEVGHIQLESDGPLCSCGRHGCAESFFGLRALANSQGCSPDELIRRSLAGDDTTLALLRSAGQRLGVLMHNLWTTLDPALFVLGGPSCHLGSAFLDSARETFEFLAGEAGLETPPVVQARFGDLSVSVGAAALVLHKLLLPL